MTPLAGPDAGRPGRAAGGDRSLAGDVRGAMTDLPADDAIDRDLLIGELEAARFAETRPARGRLEPARLGLPRWARACSRCSPASSRRWPTGWHRPPGGWRRCRRCSRPPARRWSGSAAGRSARFHTETALRQLAGIEELIADALAAAEAAPTDPAVAALAPRLDAAAATARGARSPLRDPPARRRPARERRRGPARARTLFAEKMRHTMRSDDAHAGAHPGRAPSASSSRSGPRWSGWPASSGRPGAAGRAVPTTTARSSAACSTPSPPSTRTPTTCSTSAAPRTPGSRRSAASATSSAWPTSRSTSVDAGLPALVRRRDALVAGAARQGPEGVLRDHPDARRLDARSSASRTCARTTTGCSGC